MDLEIINRLYLELSQFATAKTAKEIQLEDKLELVRVFLAECKGDTYDRISPSLKRSADLLFASIFL
jgi:hypothetical protein